MNVSPRIPCFYALKHSAIWGGTPENLYTNAIDLKFGHAVKYEIIFAFTKLDNFSISQLIASEIVTN